MLAARRSPRLGDSATRRLGSTRRRSWLPSLLPLNKQNRDAGRGTADILLFCSAAKCYRWKLNGRAYLLDDSTTAARQGAQRVRPSEEEGSSLENSRRRRQISTTTTSALPLYPCREQLVVAVPPVHATRSRCGDNTRKVERGIQHNKRKDDCLLC